MTARRLAIWAIAALTVALRPGGAASEPDAAVGLEIVEYQLDNGLRVVLHPDASTPTVVVYVWYRVGAKDEPKGRSGFAHLFEHLMFKGSKHVGDGDMDRMLEEAGGWSNGTTSSDRTTYYEQLPASHLELALYLEADRMAGLWEAMSKKVLDNQRDVVLSERRQSYENAPYGEAELLIQKALWPKGHGNHMPAIGSPADLRAATLRDVERFYRTFYVPSNATLVIAGDIDVTATRLLVDRWLGWIPERPDPPHRVLTEPVEPMAEEVRLSDRDDVHASKVLVTWRSPPPFAEGDVELAVAAQLLAGGKTSRLYRRLVFTERLASEVDAYQYPQMLGGEFQVSAVARDGVDPEHILEAIDEEVARLSAEAIDATEILRARRIIEASLLQGLEGLVARTDRLAEYAAYAGTADYLAEELAAYRAVTAEDVSEAAARWLGPGRVVMVVTPKDEKDEP